MPSQAGKHASTGKPIQPLAPAFHAELQLVIPVHAVVRRPVRVREALPGPGQHLLNLGHHGGVIFVDLRDREGYVQVVCDPDRADMFKAAEGLRNEFCIQVKGLVREIGRAHV